MWHVGDGSTSTIQMALQQSVTTKLLLKLKFLVIPIDYWNEATDTDWNYVRPFRTPRRAFYAWHRKRSVRISHKVIHYGLFLLLCLFSYDVPSISIYLVPSFLAKLPEPSTELASSFGCRAFRHLPIHLAIPRILCCNNSNI